MTKTMQASDAASTWGSGSVKSQNKAVLSSYALELMASKGELTWAGVDAPEPPPLVIVPFGAICEASLMCWRANALIISRPR